MKKQHLFSVLLPGILALSSCSTTSYMGDVLPATNNLDVYYVEKDVPHPYKVIGHISAAVTGGDENLSKPKLVEKAKAVGADAIIISGLAFTGGKDSTPYEKADAIKYTQ